MTATPVPPTPVAPGGAAPANAGGPVTLGTSGGATPPPPAPAGPAPALGPAGHVSRRPKRHTVLVVDDEPDVVKSVKDLLRLEYKVIGATSPQDAIDVLSKEDVHVVMTDQRMPEMTGVQFLSH